MKKVILTYATIGFLMLAVCIIFPVYYMDDNFIPYQIIVLSSHVLTGYTCIECGHPSMCILYVITQHACGIISMIMKEHVPFMEYRLVAWIIYTFTSISTSLISVICSKRINPFRFCYPERNVTRSNIQNEPIISEIVIESTPPQSPIPSRRRNQTQGTSTRNTLENSESTDDSTDIVSNVSSSTFESNDQVSVRITPRSNTPQMENTTERTVDDCTICLEPMPTTSANLTTTICGHVFHTHCIHRWLRQDEKCPVCLTLQSIRT